ncbi:MAG TPA: phytoene/squalene synthase family protein [Myxococcaceae bacterium]|nr:phytoene/squalene synthase family protein [Myxococcaceae bacterium]
MHLLPAEVRAGYRTAQQVARKHARSFFFASYLLVGLRRKASFALYAFCRRLDDLVDVEGGDVATLAERLARARRLVARVYRAMPELAAPELGTPERRFASDSAGSPWDLNEFAALEHCIRHFRIPEQPFQELISGMEMDLTVTRYRTYAELELYCHRVAGTVGLMMAPVLGCKDPSALTAAATLGKAMQLTNILRDIREDLARGRVYLPREELVAFSLTEDDLRRGTRDDRFRAFMRWQIQRARMLYGVAASGIPSLTGLGAQRMVKLMGSIYGDILRSIELLDYDVFSSRAYVATRRKLRLAAVVLATPHRVLGPPVQPVEVPALPIATAGESALPRA